MLNRILGNFLNATRKVACKDDVKAMIQHLADYADDRRLDDESRYRLAERFSNAVYPKFLFSEYGRIHLDDEAFIDYYRRFMDPGNWHSLDRKYFLNQTLRLLPGVAGDLVECGVYNAASAYLMCQFARLQDRHVYLFDSCQGLSEPTTADGSYWVKGALSMAENVIHHNLEEFRCYTLLKGWIPERFPEVGDRRFCFVHIDVDLYQPTLDSLEFFYGRLNTRGVMLFDDYGFCTCPGARRAIDEFFEDKPENVVLVPTGQAFLIRQPEFK
jgi:O-methyltransferase